MSAKHTPGPWDIEYGNSDSSGGGQWYEVGPAKVWYSYRSSDEEEQRAQANAHLISAAPDLLEALQVIAADSRWLSGEPTLLMARAAIAKATGEQP